MKAITTFSDPSNVATSPTYYFAFTVNSEKNQKRTERKKAKKKIYIYVIFVINERMPYSHSHRVAWPRPKAGDSVLLTFDFRSSRRGGRHHVRLEYQLPIRSENGTTTRSYSVIPLKVTHYYYRSRLNTIRPPTPPPARRSLRPSDHMFLSARVFFKSTIAANRY